MAKFIKGAYNTISEVYTVLEDLQQEGYTKSHITLVTNEDKMYRELDVSIDTQVKLEESPTENLTIWEKIVEVFPVFSSNDYYNSLDNPNMESEEEMLLKGYQKELDDGKVIVIVDDIFNKESLLHLDERDVIKNPSNSLNEVEEILQDPPETDSHPDIESLEDVLKQETTYVPGDEDTHTEK